MTALVTENMALLAGAPDGIKRLRELIVELAVNGKLLPQAPDDEPAAILLARISKERAASGVRQRSPERDEEIGQVLDLPAGWVRTNLGSQVLDSGAGWSPSCEPRPRKGDEWGVLKVSAVSWGQFRPEENKALPAHLAPRPEHEVAASDFLLSRANTAELVARSVVVDSTPPRLMLSDKIVRLKLSQSCSSRFINLANSSPAARRYYAAVAGGTSSSMKNVSREQVLSLPVLLPPLAEQHRIVAKVDELMAICDRLEAQQQGAEAAHARLVQALLDSLTQARNAEDFRASWQRLADSFHVLFTTEKSVGRLRQGIIDLATTGGLSGAVAGDGHISGRDSIGWQRVKLGELVEHSSSGWSPTCDARPRDGAEWGVLKVSAVSWGVFKPEENKALPSHLEPRADFEVAAGDFLISRANTADLVARSVVVDHSPPHLMLSDKIVCLKLKPQCDPHYINLANSSSGARKYYSTVAGGTSSSMKNVSRDQILNLPILLPPVDDQQRIVALVGVLLSLCEQLKVRIAAARVNHGQLADALVESTLT